MHTSIDWHFGVHPAGIIRASHLFKTENGDLFNQMREKTLEKLEEFEKRRKYGLEKKLKKERNKK